VNGKRVMAGSQVATTCKSMSSPPAKPCGTSEPIRFACGSAALGYTRSCCRDSTVNLLDTPAARGYRYCRCAAWVGRTVQRTINLD
jgi:hypothetical protein